MASEEKSQQLSELLKAKLGGILHCISLDRDDVIASASAEDLQQLLSLLKLDSELCFDMLVYLTAVDYLDNADERFELVYVFHSIQHGHRLRLKVLVPEQCAQVASAVHLWASANFMEREVWDMYGISFTTHPDLRRILMYDEFKGHPLRKDYPLQGKQSRVPLRHPEVRNTALDMARPELVKIGKNAGVK